MVVANCSSLKNNQICFDKKKTEVSVKVVVLLRRTNIVFDILATRLFQREKERKKIRETEGEREREKRTHHSVYAIKRFFAKGGTLKNVFGLLMSLANPSNVKLQTFKASIYQRNLYQRKKVG